MKNYLALLDKIDRFAAEVRRRHPRAFACAPGCADCCVAGITVWRVERDHAGGVSRLPGDVSHLTARKPASSSTAPGPRETPPCSEREASPKCSFLDESCRCAIYDRRPIVCRLWGMPQLVDGKLGCCGRNFQGETKLEDLAASDIVDMEVILNALAAINHVYCTKQGLDPTERLPLAP